MLVVPLLPLDQIRNWKGKGYDAIVLVGEPTSETPVDNPMTDHEVHSAFSAAHLNNDNIKTSEPKQVEDAADVLKEGVVALAEMILSMNDDELKKVQTFDENSAKRLRTSRANLTARNGVQVPEQTWKKKDDCLF